MRDSSCPVAVEPCHAVQCRAVVERVTADTGKSFVQTSVESTIEVISGHFHPIDRYPPVGRVTIDAEFGGRSRGVHVGHFHPIGRDVHVGPGAVTTFKHSLQTGTI